VHHLDEDAKSEEVGPGWEYYLVGIDERKESNDSS
jgi:hypothetical protein